MRAGRNCPLSQWPADSVASRISPMMKQYRTWWTNLYLKKLSHLFMSWYRELRAVRGKKLLLPLANVARCTEVRKSEDKYYKSLEGGKAYFLLK